MIFVMGIFLSRNGVCFFGLIRSNVEVDSSAVRHFNGKDKRVSAFENELTWVKKR